MLFGANAELRVYLRLDRVVHFLVPALPQLRLLRSLVRLVHPDVRVEVAHEARLRRGGGRDG